MAAAKGHINCVDFLVKFGINIYAQDIDRHTAKDLAGINNREDILRYLDIATTNLEQKDKLCFLYFKKFSYFEVIIIKSLVGKKQKL